MKSCRPLSVVICSLLLVACGGAPVQPPAGPILYAGGYLFNPKRVLIPIDTEGNTAGSSIALPDFPNSMQMNHSGSKLYLGSPSGLIELDPPSETAMLIVPNIPGFVRGITSDDSKVIVSDSSSTTIFNVSDSSFTTLPFQTLRAAFLPDGSAAYLASEPGVFKFIFSSASLQPMPLQDPIAGGEVVVSPSGTFFYVTASNGTIEVHAVCDNSLVETMASWGAIGMTLSPDGGRLLGLTQGAVVTDFTVHESATGACPPSHSYTVTNAGYGLSLPFATGFVMTPDFSKAYIHAVPDLGPGAFGFEVYDLGTGQATVYPLTGVGGQSYGSESEALSNDGKTLYVGSLNSIHRVDATTNQDVQTIPLTFSPDLLVLSPK